MYKYGRRAPKNAPAIKFSAVMKAMPVFPPVDYAKNFNWSTTLNGNDKYGDCVACAWANTRTLVTGVLTGKPEFPTQDQVILFYKTQNPNFPTDDEGMDIQTACEFLVKNGGPDGVKALGFVKVDHTNMAEMKAAISVFGSLIFGVTLDDAQQSQFPHVWDYVPDSPEEGGHAVVAAGHLDATQDFRAITWGAEISLTDAFAAHQLEECWAIIWPEHLGDRRFIAGMDLASFANEFQTITGRPFPVDITPVPSPPSPHNPPAPVDVDQALAVVAQKYLDAKFHSHKLLTELKKALTDWLASQ